MLNNLSDTRVPRIRGETGRFRRSRLAQCTVMLALAGGCTWNSRDAFTSRAKGKVPVSTPLPNRNENDHTEILIYDVRVGAETGSSQPRELVVAATEWRWG